MKYLLFLVVFLALPSYATCPLFGDGAACKLSEIRKPMERTYETAPGIAEYSPTPEARLNPTQDSADKKMLRSFGPKNSDYSYDSNCQFGVCNNPGGFMLFDGYK